MMADVGSGTTRPRFTLPSNVLQLLRCPECGESLAAPVGLDALRCRQCGAGYPLRDGILDMAPNLRQKVSLSRSMEARWIVQQYEHRIRPRFTSLFGRFSYEDEEALIQKYWKHGPGAMVLDVACGTGRYTRFFAEQLKADLAVGLDLSREMVRLAVEEAHDPKVFFLKGNAGRLPFADSTFDVVACMGALHLFPDPAGAVSQWARVMKPGGEVHVLTGILREGFLDKAVLLPVAQALRATWFKKQEIEGMFGRHGFRDLAYETSGRLLYLWGRMTDPRP